MSEVKDPAIKLFGRTISFPLDPCLFPNDSSGPPPPPSPPDHPTLRSSSLSEEFTSERDKVCPILRVSIYLGLTLNLVAIDCFLANIISEACNW